MNTCPSFDHLLVLPHLRVQNANAISSPLTHGFPSITAFQGLAWALERKARAAGLDLSLPAVGVVCHDHEEQVTHEGFIRAFRLTRNPIDKDGSTAAIVEEGRIHLTLSLVFAVRSRLWIEDPNAAREHAACIFSMLGGMRVAGGTLLAPEQSWRRRHQPRVISWLGDEDAQRFEFRKARMHLLPGYALVNRDDLVDERLAELQSQVPDASRLDALLSVSRFNWRYRPAGEGSQDASGKWEHDRKGWVVPIPVGYGALGEVHPAGSVSHSRDNTTPFRFVESLYSAGEWVSPHRLQSPQEFLWYPAFQPDTGTYRCRNDFRPTSNHDFD